MVPALLLVLSPSTVIMAGFHMTKCMVTLALGVRANREINVSPMFSAGDGPEKHLIR